LPQVPSIFAGIGFSPGSWPRQRPSRDAFHALRNLPGKELRYLRTLRVRADIDGGFTRSACLTRKVRRTAELNLPASVRRHPLYIPFWGLQGAVFLVNSRQGNVRCAPIYIGEALSRSYGRLFAEFLGQESPIGLGTLAPAHLCWFAVRAPCL